MRCTLWNRTEATVAAIARPRRGLLLKKKQQGRGWFRRTPIWRLRRAREWRSTRWVSRDTIPKSFITLFLFLGEVTRGCQPATLRVLQRSQRKQEVYKQFTNTVNQIKHTLWQRRCPFFLWVGKRLLLAAFL